MSIAQEFKDFALKGNMMDMAVGIIIGGAFGKIIDSLVKDVIMPGVGAIVGNVDFSNLFVVLGDNPNNLSTLKELNAAGVNTLAYGNFITIMINFLLLAIAVFMLVKGMNKLRNAEPAAPEAPAAPSAEVVLLEQIRDALKK